MAGSSKQVFTLWKKKKKQPGPQLDKQAHWSSNRSKWEKIIAQLIFLAIPNLIFLLRHESRISQTVAVVLQDQVQSKWKKGARVMTRFFLFFNGKQHSTERRNASFPLSKQQQQPLPAEKPQSTTTLFLKTKITPTWQTANRHTHKQRKTGTLPPNLLSTSTTRAILQYNYCRQCIGWLEWLHFYTAGALD